MQDPTENAVHALVHTVVDEDLAACISPDPDDEFPRVFATSRMVALMELAASRILKPLLPPGHLSVGVTIETSHIAPTAPGQVVQVHARYTGREAKLYCFEVSASDASGEIGRGTHQRAIVAVERLLAGAERRKHRGI